MFRGTLYLRPISGNLTHNTEHFGKMDPYVRVRAGTLGWQKTRAAKNQHFNPIWDDELVLSLTDETFLEIEVKNKELIHDDLIGVGSLSLSSCFDTNSNTFSKTISLFYKDTDAGTITLEGRFVPEGKFTGGQTGFAQQPLSTQTKPLLTQTNLLPTQTTTTTTTQPILEPVIHTETIKVQEQPVFVKETPIVHETEIIREKPIITEKEIISCTQPIIVEKPELRENFINRTEQPTVIREQAVFRNETGLNMGDRPLLEGAIVNKKTEFIREEPSVFKETPELFRKEIITEKPIIHEKDIIHVEKPVIVEKPEIIQREFQHVQQGEVRTEQPLIHGEKQIFSTTQPVLSQEPIVHQQQSEVITQNPVFVKERPDIYEKNIIHEKPIIHEKDILHTQKEVLIEKPEVFQTKIVHQEQPILREEPLTRTSGDVLTNKNLAKGNQNILQP